MPDSSSCSHEFHRPPPDCRSGRRPPLFPLSSLPSFLDLSPACVGYMRRARVWGICPRFPASAQLPILFSRAHGRMAFPQRVQCGCACFFPMRIAFLLLWRPSDALAMRCHRPEGHGGTDAQVEKSPGRQGNALKTMLATINFIALRTLRSCGQGGTNGPFSTSRLWESKVMGA